SADLARMGRGGDSSVRLYGRIDGASIRASGASAFACTLSLTRDSSTGQTASSAYDGTYVYSTQSVVLYGITTFTLRVEKSSGRLTITNAACNDSQFDVTVSPSGEISGKGDLKCFVSQPGGPTSTLVGPLSIAGRIADRKATLRLYSSRSDYSFV